MMDPGHVLIVDDEPVIRQALAWLMKSKGLESRGFASGEAFLEFFRSPEGPRLRPAVVILDMRMPPGLHGAAVFEQLVQSQLAPDVPVIFLTGHGDVPMAVDALKRGAFDFFEKPFNDNLLVERVQQGLVVSGERGKRGAAQLDVGMRLESLTEREREVMRLVLAGRLNKQIADALNVTLRTVEVHRARVLAKMGARNAVELAAILHRDGPV